MPIRVRFVLWIICIFGLFVFAPLASRQLVTDFTSGAFLTLTAASVACYFGLVLLLQSTPANAIKLPPQQSVRWVTAGTLWLYFSCYGPILFPRVTIISSEIAESVAILMAFVTVSGTVAYFLSRQLARRNMSPWSATVILWMPAFVGPFGHPVFAALMFAGLALVIVVSLARRPN